MSLKGILIYCLRAAAFATAVCAFYALYCLLRRKRPGLRCLLALAYLAALVQITVLRGGISWQAVLQGGRSMQLVPLKTTIAELRRGAWPLIYHVLGNLLWFAPLGFLLRRGKWIRALSVGAACSAGIELAQLILMTGSADVDDLMLNSLGALVGWMLGRLIERMLEGRKVASDK